MHAGLFDVLHDAGDEDVFSIGESVHVDFGGVFQEAVDQYGPFLRERHGFAHVLAHRLFVVGDHHGAPAQHVAGPHQYRVADAPRDFARFFHAGCRSIRRAGNAEVFEQAPEKLAVLGEIDVLGIGPDDRHAQFLERNRQIQGRLPAELHDHTIRLFRVIDVQHVLERERLEVQPVAGIVVRRNRLGVAVDHDRLDAIFLQRERCVAAAVIELNALADAVRTAAQDHDLLARRRAPLRTRIRKSNRGTA